MKFVHMPTERTYLIPNGMIPLANLIKSNGFDVEVIHYGIDPIDLSNEELVLFDLHWHDQCVPVIDKCKELSCKKILGGFTATYYANEILQNYPVDYVIQGYAESELLEMLTGIKRKIDINSLEYSNFDILRNYDKYLKDKIFIFSPGRGCPSNCTYCGGALDIQIGCGMPKPLFLKHEKVLQELRNSLKYGIEKWLVSFDPAPDGDYYIKLFDMIDFDIQCKFDCWGLPTKQFIDKFSETFKDGEITISPKIGNEQLRVRNKGMSFTNDDLFYIIDHMSKRSVKYKIYIATNFPDDSIDYLVNKIGADKCLTGDIVMEPGSKLYDIKDFKTLYRIHKLIGLGPLRNL